jgi:hypothetical protein
MAAPRYVYTDYDGHHLVQKGFLWIQPPAIQAPHHTYETFVEQQGEGDEVVMKKVVGPLDDSSLHLYYDRFNGRRLYFLQRVEPHPAAIETEDFGMPAPKAHFEDDRRPGLRMCRSDWMYCHDLPLESVGNRVGVKDGVCHEV